MATYSYNFLTSEFQAAGTVIYPGDSISVLGPFSATPVTYKIVTTDANGVSILLASKKVQADPNPWEYTFTESMLDNIPDASTKTMTIGYYEGTGTGGLGFTKSRNVIMGVPTTEVPTISSATLQESAATQGYATQFGTFIKNRSILATKISAQASLGTKISRVELFAGANTSGTFLGGGDITPVETLTDYIITETSPITATSGQRTIRVTDMRGRTTTQTVSFTALAYTPPTLTNVTLQRTDSTGAVQNTGTYMRYAITGNIQSLKPNGTTEKNTKALTMRWRIAGSTGAWDSDSIPVSVGTINLDAFLGTSHVFSDSISYEFEVVLTDFFGSVTRTASLPKAFVLLHGYKDGTGLAVGKFAEQGNLFDVGLPARFRQGAQFDGALTVAQSTLSALRLALGIGRATLFNAATQKSGNVAADAYYLFRWANYGGYDDNVFDLYALTSGAGYYHGAKVKRAGKYLVNARINFDSGITTSSRVRIYTASIKSGVTPLETYTTQANMLAQLNDYGYLTVAASAGSVGQAGVSFILQCEANEIIAVYGGATVAATPGTSGKLSIMYVGD